MFETSANNLTRRRMVRNLIAGSLFLLAGLCILVQVCGLWDLEPLMRHWWALFLIVPAVISILATGPRYLNVMLLILGVCTLLYSWGILHENALKALPGLLLIYVGLRHITGQSRHSRRMNRE